MLAGTSARPPASAAKVATGTARSTVASAGSAASLPRPRHLDGDRRPCADAEDHLGAVRNSGPLPDEVGQEVREKIGHSLLCGPPSGVPGTADGTADVLFMAPAVHHPQGEQVRDGPRAGRGRRLRGEIIRGQPTQLRQPFGGHLTELIEYRGAGAWGNAWSGWCSARRFSFR